MWFLLSHTATVSVESIDPEVLLSDVSDSLSNEQLESILAARCCRREEELLVSSKVHVASGADRHFDITFIQIAGS